MKHMPLVTQDAISAHLLLNQDAALTRAGDLADLPVAKALLIQLLSDLGQPINAETLGVTGVIAGTFFTLGASLRPSLRPDGISTRKYESDRVAGCWLAGKYYYSRPKGGAKRGKR